MEESRIDEEIEGYVSEDEDSYDQEFPIYV